MHSRLASLIVAGFAASTLVGCVIHNDNGNNNQQTVFPGNVSLLWTFGDGQGCANLGGLVDHIQIQIPGESLQNGGIFACQTAGTQGIQLNDFSAGTYTFTVDAVDAQGLSTYHGDGSFTVNGDVAVSVVLQSTGQGGLAGMDLRWSFLDGMNRQLTCAQAQVSNVTVTIDGTVQTVPCSVNGVDGADFINLSAGSHTFQVDAYQQQNLVYSTGSKTTGLVGGQDNLLQVALSPQDAELDLSYNFQNAAGCSAAGVQGLSLSIRDAHNQELSGQVQGQLMSCGDGVILQYAHFPPGPITIQMYGYDSGNRVIRGASVATTIVAGGANSLTVTLNTCGSAGSNC